MLDFDKYKNTITLVTYSDKNKRIAEQMQKVNEQRLTKAEYDAALQSVVSLADEWKNETAKAYRNKEAELQKQFRHDLEADLDVNTLPGSLRDAFWNRVYADGHSGGYSEIYDVAVTWVDLVLDAYNAGKANLWVLI